MTAAEILEISRAVQAAYPHIEVGDDWLELWLNAFVDNGGSQVQAAVGLWINSEDRPPTVAGIRQKMREQATQMAREATMYTSRLEPGEKYVSIEEGKAIAAIAYERDCQEQGKEPNWDWWNQAMGLIGKAKKAGTR